MGVFGVTIYSTFTEELNKDAFQKGKPKEETRGETRGETKEKILQLITWKSKITIPELAEEIGITEKGIEYQLRNLRKDKIVRRVGPTKGGHWEIVDQKQ